MPTRFRQVRALLDIPPDVNTPEAIIDAIEEGDMDPTVRIVWILEEEEEHAVDHG